MNCRKFAGNFAWTVIFLNAATASAQITPTNNGQDIIVSEVGDTGSSGAQKWGTLTTATGDVTGYSLRSVSCNIGNATANWVDDSNNTPLIGQNLYRFKTVN